VAKTPNLTGTNNPAAGSPEQQPRQHNEAEWKHADASSPADVDCDVMRYEPEHGRRSQDGRQADLTMWRSDPAS
jgi:hypothetical protein